MIDEILKDIDKEECYYVGTNGCLYQDLDKKELLAIKQEIERLQNIIDTLEEMCKKKYYELNTIDIDKIVISDDLYVQMYQKIQELKENKK